MSNPNEERKLPFDWKSLRDPDDDLPNHCPYGWEPVPVGDPLKFGDYYWSKYTSWTIVQASWIDSPVRSGSFAYIRQKPKETTWSCSKPRCRGFTSPLGSPCFWCGSEQR